MVDELQGSGHSILVVDDEAGMREGCRRALTPEGYRVDTAANLATATSMIRTGAYDLFLLDVMLPDGSGLDMIGPILQRDANAVCIVITGFGSIEMAVAAVRRGAYDFISKPFTSDELIMAVNQGLERRRLKAIEMEAADLARAKAELERLDEVKSQLMLKVAHELRAPVAAVQSYVNLILAGYLAESELNPTLSRIQERLQEMLDLTSDLLELARLKEARHQLVASASPQPVADLVEEVCDLLREQARSKDQTLIVDIADRPTMIANRTHLKQVWTNLVSNAIKYTHSGGRITVSLCSEGDHVLGFVEDNGMGISEKDLAQLFQEFFRTDQAKASGEIGTGLGLSIVKQIVDAYGGQIKVNSQLGEGTRFTITLPLDPTQHQPAPSVATPSPLPAVHRPMPDSRTHARALIVEDDG
jgi:two-component system sensor histidine kinase/response regulator